MELGVKDRLMLLGMLPAEGNFITLKLVRQLRESLSFTEEEIKTFKIEEDGNSVRWDDKAEVPKDMAIGEKATDVIVNALKRREQEGKLPIDALDLYTKFVSVVPDEQM